MLNTPFLPLAHFTHEEADAVAARAACPTASTTGRAMNAASSNASSRPGVGARHAVALANGTLALDLACRRSASARAMKSSSRRARLWPSVSCIVNAGARARFCRCRPRQQNITAETIDAVLTPRTRAIIACIWPAGPATWTRSWRWPRDTRLKVIEDCAQAHGARYKGRTVGSIGHVGAWSFCQDKIMTTGGEGGMVTTNDEALWRAPVGRTRTMARARGGLRARHPPGFRWLHESFGTNWRMLEMQAAIGRIQLRRMVEWTAVAGQRGRSGDHFAALCG